MHSCKYTETTVTNAFLVQIIHDSRKILEIRQRGGPSSLTDISWFPYTDRIYCRIPVIGLKIHPSLPLSYIIETLTSYVPVCSLTLPGGSPVVISKSRLNISLQLYFYHQGFSTLERLSWLQACKISTFCLNT